MAFFLESFLQASRLLAAGRGAAFDGAAKLRRHRLAFGYCFSG
jgi:hypothetical protein